MGQIGEQALAFRWAGHAQKFWGVGPALGDREEWALHMDAQDACLIAPGLMALLVHRRDDRLKGSPDIRQGGSGCRRQQAGGAGTQVASGDGGDGLWGSVRVVGAAASMHVDIDIAGADDGAS